MRTENALRAGNTLKNSCTIYTFFVAAKQLSIAALPSGVSGFDDFDNSDENSYWLKVAFVFYIQRS